MCELSGALATLSGEVWRLGDDDLTTLVEQLDTLSTATHAALATLTAEAVDRGHVSERHVRGWLGEHAAGLRGDGAGRLASFLSATRDAQSSRSRAHLAPVRRAVLTGDLTVAEGVKIVAGLKRVSDRVPDQGGPDPLTQTQLAALPPTERAAAEEVMRGLASDADLLGRYGRPTDQGVPSLWESVTAGMIRMAPVDSRHLSPLALQVIARFAPGALEKREDAARRHRSLSAGFEALDGVTEYRLLLDPEAAMILENAVGPLSAPEPVDGEPDLRPYEQRRGDALVTLVDAATRSTGEHQRAKTQLLLTMTLPDLLHDLGAATTLGGLETGTPLSPATVRKLACDAEIIPVVLGTPSIALDVGHTSRLFTGGRLAALHLRDQGCTYPGCTVPPKWCDGHHLVHWIDGGGTDRDNGALLCARHHTLVHQRRLSARCDPDTGQVVWDTTPGSYDTLLSARGDPPRWAPRDP